MFSSKLSQSIMANIPSPSYIQGLYRTTIGSKYRIAVPTGIREQIADDATKSLLITFVPDKFPYCSLIPATYAQTIHTVLAEYAFDQNYASEVLRFVASSNEIYLDANGRLLIPSVLRDHFPLSPGDKLYCVGYYYQIRIYKADVYNALIKC